MNSAQFPDRLKKNADAICYHASTGNINQLLSTNSIEFTYHSDWEPYKCEGRHEVDGCQHF